MPSLKQFHIMFVSISILMFLFFGYWSYVQDSKFYLSVSILSIIILMVYGKLFYQKAKELN
ncbi:hypothetical protein N9597_00385 [Candidatus Marinimicrobia bacterium]|jgi:hypothetical protein|nr:hypothetical protein [Candidatus Neomarinimicrobiota bacterium]